ncbi:right-handed parallel beta-helix repeat-containing protein [Myxococcota bacterium]|nr:right-handed parallel beta-helix repeat-containing protein [Myxococcota bacterium]
MSSAPRRTRTGLALGALLLPLTNVQAADIVVDPGGDGDFTGIQAAIDAASDGDRVLIEPGLYPGGINLSGKNIVLISTSGPTVTEINSLDTPDESTILAISGEPLSATVSGLTLLGGHGTQHQWLAGNAWSGAGIYVQDSALSIEGCVIRQNLARHSGQSIGGGVVVIDGEVNIADTAFTGNLGYYGGGAIAALSSEVLVDGSTFRENVSARGGAIYVGEGSEVIVQSSVFEGNEASWGGAFYVVDSDLVVTSSRVALSSALIDGGTIFVKDAVVLLDDVMSGPSVAERDGGHLRIATGGSVEATASVFSSGLAVGGGAVAMRGDDVSFVADGVVFSENSALDGGDLWVFDGVASLTNVTSLSANAGSTGSVIWLGDGATATAINSIAFTPSGPFVLFTEDGASLSWEWSLLYGETGEQTGGALGGLTGDGLLFGDPLLAAPDARPPDVTLLDGSPALDAGEPTTLDTDGTRADLGATGGLHPWSR